METHKQKFRIKVEELNDGSKMYYPQVCVGKKYLQTMSMFWYILTYPFHRGLGTIGIIPDWRGLCLKEGFRDISDSEDGCGASDIKFAEDEIIKYKKHQMLRDAIEKEKFNKQTKEISYIEIPE